jgi:hypothetical protein
MSLIGRNKVGCRHGKLITGSDSTMQMTIASYRVRRKLSPGQDRGTKVGTSFE